MLGNVSEQQVKQIVEESLAAGRSPLPYLRDEGVRRRALEIARQQGLLARLQERLAPEQALEVLPYSRFREFRRTGNRTHYERLLHHRSSQIQSAAMACYLGSDHLRYLQDLLWGECEASWWVYPAHERPGEPIDLWAAMSARAYATIIALLEERLEPEIKERVTAEIRRRVFDEFFNPAFRSWWKTCTNNWNAVCHSGVCIAAMLLERDAARLARIITESLTNLERFLEGFTPDGGCTEGPGYWIFGFGWYVDLAAALHDFSGGAINIMAGERLEAISRYALTAWIKPGQNLPFADTPQSYLSPHLALTVNRFHAVPELFGLCRLSQDGWLAVEALDDLLLYDGATYRPLEDRTDHYLPDLAVALVRGGGLAVAAKAGHNAEHHNHNDVGSFVVHRGRTFFLTDPGAPVYSAKTFSQRRYESIFCNSFGHGVPVVNGRLQQTGKEFRGTMQAAGLGAGGAKTIRIEMAGAYAVPALGRLERVIQLPAGGGAVGITDSYVFKEAPSAVEEAFMTALPAKASADGKTVTIRSESDGQMRLVVETAGKFAVAELTTESAESPRGDLLRRIAFLPAKLGKTMTLRFRLE